MVVVATPLTSNAAPPVAEGGGGVEVVTDNKVTLRPFAVVATGLVSVLMSAARWPAPERHFLAGGLGGSAPTTTTPLLFFRTGVTVTGDWVDDE